MKRSAARPLTVFCITSFTAGVGCGAGDRVQASGGHEASGGATLNDIQVGFGDDYGDTDDGTGSADEGASNSNSLSGGETGDGTIGETGDSVSSGQDTSAAGDGGEGNDGSEGNEGSEGNDGETLDGDSTSTGPDDGGGDTDGDIPGVRTGPCDTPGQEVACYSYNPLTYEVGACHGGTQVCVAIDLGLGEWSPCTDDHGPALETCDGADNDCNGAIDENLGETTCGHGLCQHTEPNCIAGIPQTCDPTVGGSLEVCDGQDNDCDGDIDEGIGEQTTSCGLGQCQHEVSNCISGGQATCDPYEGAFDETCDGLDNDCDGFVDEDLGTVTCGSGACLHTVAACVGGVPQDCDPHQGKTDEVCDGVDNDCDAQIDEDQANWTCGTGICQNTAPSCVDGVPQSSDMCSPNVAVEICGDKVDNDCDGVTLHCSEAFAGGTNTTYRPVEVIWAVDTSLSMAEEIATIKTEINDFAAAVGGDVAVHMIGDWGTNAFNVCVPMPLAAVNCADNPSSFHYDSNYSSAQGDVTNPRTSMVHSNNALGRIMQQCKSGAGNGTGWCDRLRPNAMLAFVIVTDDDGQDSNKYITDGTTSNNTRWQDGSTIYSSVSEDIDTNSNGVADVYGFNTFMANKFPSNTAGVDWRVYPILGATGSQVLTGTDDQYEFTCPTAADAGEEYVKLAKTTGTLPDMIPLCSIDWDLSGLGQAIAESVPNDTFVLAGSPSCGNIDPSTITVTVNGALRGGSDWTYDAATCTLKFVANIPTTGDDVVVSYDNF